MRRLFALLVLVSVSAAAQAPLQSAPPRKAVAPLAPVWVELDAPTRETTLIRHVGTSVGAVGSTTMVLTTISKECEAPCKQYIEDPKSDFYIAGQGITPSAAFSLMSYPDGVKVKVAPGSYPLRLGGVILGSTAIGALALGIPLLILSAGRQQVQNPYDAPRSNSMGDIGLASTIIGGAALLGAVPMMAFSGTKLEFFPLPPAPASPAPNPSEV